jgi:arsenate reductase
MRNRIEAFVNLPLQSIDQMALAARLKGIGAMDGSTFRAPQVA